MYTVIGSAQSRTFRVIWMLEELGEPYERIPAKQHTPEILQHSPLGKVPVLLDDGEPITDSAAILTYLADKHGKLTAKAGTIARARQDGMTFHVLDDLEGVIWMATRHGFILPEEHRVAGVRDSAKWEWARNLRAIEKRFKGPFLMGEEMTVPDILLTHTLNWGLNAKFPVESDLIQAYLKRMREREAFQRAVASEKSVA